MIFEIAEINVVAGKEDEFIRAASEAVPLFMEADGCFSMQIQRSFERINHFWLIVGWETIEHHTEVFRNSAAFQRWRELVSPFFATAPVVEHATAAVRGF